MNTDQLRELIVRLSNRTVFHEPTAIRHGYSTPDEDCVTAAKVLQELSAQRAQGVTEEMVDRACYAYDNAEPRIRIGSSRYYMRAALQSIQPSAESARKAALDTVRLDWLEGITKTGAAPQLVYDDNGHWAVSFDGMSSVPSGDAPEDASITAIVYAEDWKNSPREAIDAEMEKDAAIAAKDSHD